MFDSNKVNILLVDDQPGKLLTYEAMLNDIGENVLRANSGREALEHLLRTEVAVILLDVCMPDLDGFQLAAMIREHPRFQKTAMIFVSAIHLSDMDRLRGYEMGAVDYVPVPVVPEVLRAKVRVFCELYRKSRDLELLNRDLEQRVVQRTAELEEAALQLRRSEQRRSLALAAGNMGSWQWNRSTDEYQWDEGQYRIFGVDQESFVPTSESIRARIDADDWTRLQIANQRLASSGESHQIEFRVVRPNGEVRWCLGATAGAMADEPDVICGVTLDITERKKAEERQELLAREVDHRAKNALALVQSIVRLTKASDQKTYVAAVEGRIRALSRAHTVLAQARWEGASLNNLIEEELAPFRIGDPRRVELKGPQVMLQPAAAQTLALALHELATNAAKYGALSVLDGRLTLQWCVRGDELQLDWEEYGGPPVVPPSSQGFGSRVLRASVEGQLRGRLALDWRPNGLSCRLSIPSPGKGGVASPVEQRVESAPALISLAGNRILVVEDESVIALALCETLSQLGYDVVGPCSSADEAFKLATSCDLDGAILDINLNGKLVYPVADALVQRRVPFIFVTGYGVESIDRRFRTVPAFQKPIESHVLAQIFGHPSRQAARGSAQVAVN